MAWDEELVPISGVFRKTPKRFPQRFSTIDNASSHSLNGTVSVSDPDQSNIVNNHLIRISPVRLKTDYSIVQVGRQGPKTFEVSWILKEFRATTKFRSVLPAPFVPE